jgi:hypothetical protein
VSPHGPDLFGEDPDKDLREGIRRDLANFGKAPAEVETGTHRAAVLAILSDHEWHSTIEFQNPRCGSEGLRRLRELRETHEIERRRREGSAQFEYRLKGEK